MNKFLREHVLDLMMDPKFEVKKGYFSKDEDIQTQIKFLRNKFNTIISLNDFKMFVEYVNEIVEHNDFKFGISKKIYIKQCIALIIFLDTLVNEKNRPKVLQNITFKSIMHKFKPILSRAFTLGITLDCMISSEMAISFIDLVYNISESAKYLPKKIKDTCLSDISYQYLIKIHMYDYMAKNIDPRVIICYDNLFELIVWQDEELCIYNDYPHWDQFQIALQKIIRKLLKAKYIPLQIIKDNLTAANNSVVKSNAMKVFLQFLCKKIDNHIKYLERVKKAKATIPTTENKLTWSAGTPITTTCIDPIAIKNEIADGLAECNAEIEKIKQNSSHIKKTKINGGY